MTAGVSMSSRINPKPAPPRHRLAPAVRPAPAVFEAAGHRGIARVGPATLLASAGDAFFGGEARRIEARYGEGAIGKPSTQFAKGADADVAPGGRNNHRVDHRPLDAVERGRLVPFVDDADRHQHHPRAQVEAAMHHQVDVGLFDGDLAGLFPAFDFDECVLDLDLRPELDAIGKAMADHQDEAMQIRFGRQVLHLVEVHLHVARECRHAVASLGVRHVGDREEDQQLPRHKTM